MGPISKYCRRRRVRTRAINRKLPDPVARFASELPRPTDRRRFTGWHIFREWNPLKEGGDYREYQKELSNRWRALPENIRSHYNYLAQLRREQVDDLPFECEVMPEVTIPLDLPEDLFDFSFLKSVDLSHLKVEPVR